MTDRIRLGVLASGGGTNLQAIMDSCAEDRISAEVAVVVSDVQCGALRRAEDAGIPAILVDHHDTVRYPSRQVFDKAVLGHLRQYGVELVCLAGYLRVLTEVILDEYRSDKPHPDGHRRGIMNIHPSLLPAFGGKGMWGRRVHEAVIEYGEKISGCTVHFVWPEIDAGPIILQQDVQVETDDTPDTLAARILPLEHEIYSAAIQLFAEGRLHIEGRTVPLPGFHLKPLSSVRLPRTARA